MLINKVVLIGAGRLGSHIARELKQNKINIAQIYNRSDYSANILAHKHACKYTTNIDRILPDADLYIIAITDSAISEFTSKFNVKDKIIIHTAGSVPMDILKKSSSNYGVVYPLQTFSRFNSPDFKTTPLFIEANTKELENTLDSFFKVVSRSIHHLSSEKRKQLHLAATFANNFSNYMFVIADEILKKSNIKFSLMKPLIKETFEKAFVKTPLEAQTGPAVREDHDIIMRHKDLLKTYSDYKKIYEAITESIEKHKLKERDG